MLYLEKRRAVNETFRDGLWNVVARHHSLDHVGSHSWRQCTQGVVVRGAGVIHGTPHGAPCLDNGVSNLRRQPQGVNTVDIPSHAGQGLYAGLTVHVVLYRGCPTLSWAFSFCSVSPTYSSPECKQKKRLHNLQGSTSGNIPSSHKQFVPGHQGSVAFLSTHMAGVPGVCGLY